MLGKGLESLIPPSRSGQPAEGQPQGQGGQGYPAEPQKPYPAPAAPQDVPVALPAHEEILIEPPQELPVLDSVPETMILPTEEQARHEPVQTVPLTKVELEPHATEMQSEAHSREIAGQYGAKTTKQRGESIFYLETELIHPNQNQPRKHFDEEALNDLAASIREFGILQPLTVTRIEKEIPGGGTAVEYELIAGERRLQAARRAGLERVPAIIRVVDAARERLELAVIENIQRENLSPIELARSFARLQDEFRLTQREIATRLGKSREVVANTLRLLDLPGYIQEALEKGQVSESHGRLLLSIEDPAAQQALFHDLLNQHLTTRELRRRTAFLKNKQGSESTSSAAGISPELKHFEERLATELGAPVSIKPAAGGSGKITIEFYSSEELEQIMRRFADEGGL